MKVFKAPFLTKKKNPDWTLTDKTQSPAHETCFARRWGGGGWAVTAVMETAHKRQQENLGKAIIESSTSKLRKYKRCPFADYCRLLHTRRGITNRTAPMHNYDYKEHFITRSDSGSANDSDRGRRGA